MLLHYVKVYHRKLTSGKFESSIRKPSSKQSTFRAFPVIFPSPTRPLKRSLIYSAKKGAILPRVARKPATEERCLSVFREGSPWTDSRVAGRRTTRRLYAVPA